MISLHQLQISWLISFIAPFILNIIQIFTFKVNNSLDIVFWSGYDSRVVLRFIDFTDNRIINIDNCYQ